MCQSCSRDRSGELSNKAGGSLASFFPKQRPILAYSLAIPRGEIMQPKDWLVLAAAAATNPLQPVQIQKILFLLDKKLSPAQKRMARIYTFAPYDYGPFDASVYWDAERLEQEGMLTIERAPGQTFKQYRITDAGRVHAVAIEEQIDPAVRSYVGALVRWCQGLSFNQLVSAVYQEYPEMRENSVFRG